jgi:trigger factor
MEVNVEDISSVKKILRVEIPEAEVTRELKKAYGSLKNTANIRGFRPGKVPLSLLERRFQKEIHADVSGQLIQNSYGEALRRAELAPIGEPTIERPELEKGHPYQYSVTIEVAPFIDDLKLSALKLKQKVHHVKEKEIEAQLKMLQKQRAELRDIDKSRPVGNGDIVIIDYEGFKDGKPLEAAGKTENFQVEVGSGRILKDFDQALVGMEPASKKTFEVRFPDDYYNDKLAGLEVAFEVLLREIKEEILPPLDDGFAKEFGDYDTLEALKEAIKKELEKRYEVQSERQLHDDIIQALIEQSDFEVPEGLVKEELSSLLADARTTASRRGMSTEEFEEAREGLSERLRPVAERKVREYLLLRKVVEQEEIALSDELVEEAYNDLAEAMGQPVNVIKQFHESYKDAYEIFKHKALEKEAVRQIKGKNEVEKVEAEA